MSTSAEQTRLRTIDEALALVASRTSPLADPVEVPIDEALGRIVVEEVRAETDMPSFASSAMDGYAVQAADTPGTLGVIGESAAGAPYAGELAPSAAITISTGAVVPVGADAVVPVEDTIALDERVELRSAARPGDHIRPAGSDVPAGTLLLAPGVRLRAGQIGAAASIGRSSLRCGRLPMVAIIATGSELRAPGETLREGDIYDSNGPMLRAALSSAGAEVATIRTARDTHDAHREALERALEHDVVITTGGVSVGPHDLVRGIGAELGVEELFWRVALRPGKPVWFGARGATLVFGLPGNPVSTLVCFELFVRPALLRLQGAPFSPGFRTGVLNRPARRSPQRDDLIRVRYAASASASEAAVALEPIAGQQSHQIAVTAGADAVARIPAGEGELPAGTAVQYLPL
jgi:molybdopterin molybdotransferase